MGLGITIDATAQFNATGIYNIDMTGYETAVVQLVGPAAAVTFNSSNDGGAITGSVGESPLAAANFTAVQAINLNTGVGATTGAVSGLWRVQYIGRYLQLSGTTATKILVFLSKIS